MEKDFPWSTPQLRKLDKPVRADDVKGQNVYAMLPGIVSDKLGIIILCMQQHLHCEYVHHLGHCDGHIVIDPLPF